MSERWTTQQVLDLAPDESSAKAGRGLSSVNKWDNLGKSPRAIWGEIRGSGKKPYQARIDLSEPAFKCSCPSRKFPCKHALALFLLYAEHGRSFNEDDPPAWVAEWLEKRDSREEKRAAKPSKPREVDREAQARRVEKREKKVQAGIEELRLWLTDLLRQGLGTAQSQPHGYWSNIAARMVDAQASGLSRYILQLHDYVSSGIGWQARTLRAMGRLHLLLEAHQRLDTLPADLQSDVRTCIGWTTSKEELAKLDPVEDTWVVLGQRVLHEDQLKVQRTWLWGIESASPAMILLFAPGNQGFDTTFSVGGQFHGKLVYYPSARPLRATIIDRAADETISEELPAALAVDAALIEYANAIAANPWIELWPQRLAGVVPQMLHTADGAQLCLVGDDGQYVAIDPRVDCGWQLPAISGGSAISVCGEWDGDVLRPLSATANNKSYVMVQTESGNVLYRVA